MLSDLCLTVQSKNGKSDIVADFAWSGLCNMKQGKAKTKGTHMHNLCQAYQGCELVCEREASYLGFRMRLYIDSNPACILLVISCPRVSFRSLLKAA